MSIYEKIIREELPIQMKMDENDPFEKELLNVIHAYENYINDKIQPLIYQSNSDKINIKSFEQFLNNLK